MFISTRWSTASLGEVPGSSASELTALQDHVVVCHGMYGRWFTARRRFEAIHVFVAARFVSTLVASTCVLAALVWVL